MGLSVGFVAELYQVAVTFNLYYLSLSALHYGVN